MRTNLFAVSKYRESDTASVELKRIQSFVRFLKNIITVLKLHNITNVLVKSMVRSSLTVMAFTGIYVRC